jgi:hypothetical protein
MKVIYKYPFEIKERFKLEIPKGAQVLKVGFDKKIDMFCFWCLIDGANRTEERGFAVVGTGQFEEILQGHLETKYVATIESRDEQFVWHIFEILRPRLKASE